jgi:hypothetical protein
MTKRVHFLLIVALIAVSACNNASKTDETAIKNDTVLLTVLTFEQLADSSVDKPVIIEGTVFHTCKHGGKRMFLIDGTDSIRVEVTAGGEVAKFEETLIGSRVRVKGFLREERIDAKYLNEWEAEVLKPEDNHTVGVHTGAKGHEDHSVQDKLDQIKALREELAASGKDHLSNFSVEAINYMELK